jgi:hypothetical protein
MADGVYTQLTRLTAPGMKTFVSEAVKVAKDSAGTS